MATGRMGFSVRLSVRPLFHILKDFRNAPPAKMLIYCKKIYFNYMINKIDKSHHLACIHYENRNAVVYGCRDVAIILMQP